jgi:RHS repeat-associated protein
MTYPNARVINYNYASGLDASISRLSSVSDSSATLEIYKYLGLSTIVEMGHPQTNVNLTFMTQTGSTGDAGDKYVGLDRFGRVVDQNWYNTATSTSTDQFQYGYDRDSNVLFMKNTLSTTNSELYAYNGLNALTSFKRGTLNGTNTAMSGSPSIDESWGLDAAGNWTSVTTNGSTQTRTANANNQITSISGLTTPGYDGNGNMTTDQAGKTIVYDAWNRLVKYKNGSTVLEINSYDALGRKVVENAGTATDIYFSKYWQNIQENVSGTAKTQYIWGVGYIDHLIERDRDADGDSGNGLEERLYSLQNANWDVTALVNASGTVQERYLYDTYGAVTILTGAWGARGSSSFGWVVLHQGGRLDAVTGLYAFRNREYSSMLGRWVQEDPLGIGSLGGNLYLYLNNSPVNYGDPTGLSPIRPLFLVPVWQWPVDPPQIIGGPPVALGPGGQWQWPVTFRPTKAGPKGGVIIQLIQVCGGLGHAISQIPPYAEGWNVTPNSTNVRPVMPGTNFNDNFSWIGPQPGWGTIQVTGTLFYFPTLTKLPAYFRKGGKNDPSGGLPHVRVEGDHCFDLVDLFRNYPHSKGVCHELIVEYDGNKTTILEFTSGKPTGHWWPTLLQPYSPFWPFAPGQR